MEMLNVIITASICSALVFADTHPVRLVSSGSSYTSGGIVEIQNAGVWGLVCGDDWTEANSDVVCRQLGFNGGLSYTHSVSDYLLNPKDVILDGVDCSGQEESLAECSYYSWGYGYCYYSTVNVICSEFDFNSDYEKIRLVGGESANEGILEVVTNGQWGTVCGNDWGIEEAKVICRELGYTGVDGYSEERNEYEIGNTELHPINLYDVDCTSYATELSSCILNTDELWGCDHQSDVALSCTQATNLQYGDIRLVGGQSESEGVLEMYVGGSWRTICDWGWYKDEGDVACKQLGYSYASDYDASYYDFNYDKATSLDNDMKSFDCYGDETSLLSCTEVDSNCYGYYSDIVAIRCSNSSSTVGTVIGILVFIIIIIVVVGCCCRRQRRNAATRTTTVALANQPVQVHQPVQQTLIQQPGQPYPVPAGHPPPQPGQGYPAQPTQGYPPQGYPPQGYPPQPAQGYPPQPSHGYPPQPSHGYPPQPTQGYPPQVGYIPQSEKGEAYPTQPYPPNQGYPAQPVGGPAYPVQPSAPTAEPAEQPPQYNDAVQGYTTYPPT